MGRPLGKRDAKPRKRRYPALRALAAIGFPDSHLVDIARAIRRDKRGAFMALVELRKAGLVVRTGWGRYARTADRVTIPE